MTQRSTYEVKLEVQSLLYQINQALAHLEPPKVEVTEEGTGIITHPRSVHLSCVKEITSALLESEDAAELIMSRCV